MSRRRPRTWVLALALSCAFLPGLARGQTPEGVIIRVEASLAYIDAGQQQGLMEGDLLDIMSSETLTHPLSGDTLSVTPMAVGALRVRQVFARFAIGEVVHLEPGQDPMLMPVYRIMDPERMSQVMLYAQRYAYAAAGSGVPRHLALIPGLHQFKLGAPGKGWTLLGLEAASLTTGVLCRIQSDNYYENYHGLDGRYSVDEFDRQFDRASTWRRRSNLAFWLAGAVWAYNWIDVLWLGKGPSLESGMEMSSQGLPLFQVAYRF
ncbi:MAG: hypothetical protein HYW07_08110 [Candidatus Latescibacteria bacterium]|nr:hypothetical protein [Candidatus Latescibacterota bacterium]